MRKGHRGERPKEEGPRKNDKIRITPVRVVLDDGTQLGVMPTHLAKAKAISLGLDLVEVSPNTRPPVCKIIDYGRYKYEQTKKESERKRKQHRVQLKQIKLRPKTDDHDLNFKVRAARRFLEEGNKVQFEVRFRGRENAHPEEGEYLLTRIFEALEDIAKVERSPTYEGRSMLSIVVPK